MSKFSLKLLQIINKYLINNATWNMKPNFNNSSDIKGLRFLTKEICLYYCHFLHIKKTQEGQAFIGLMNRFPWSHLEYTTFKTNIIKVGLVFSISNFYITKTSLANKWMSKKKTSCSNSALEITIFIGPLKLVGLPPYLCQTK